MSTPSAPGTAAKVAGFAVAVAAVFGVAVLLGRFVGPIDDPATDPMAGHGAERMDDTAEMGADAHAVPGGLQVSQDGYTLDLAHGTVRAGAARPVAFTITGPDGEPLTAYDVQHEKRLHLIAVRRDLTGFQHVHPVLTDGVWRTDLALTAGDWRLIADFAPAGAEPLALGADLAVAGDYRPAERRPESRTATVGDYRVTLHGDLAAGEDALLTLTVTEDGRPVTDLQPYLGAYGHLVALREGDLAYLHVHPDGEPGDGSTDPGPDVVFHAEVPSAGRYHLYLDFRHRGVVRTAAFTVAAR
ncbi:hypothetical protein [Nocardioides panacisoli]|uniref:Heavy-metal-associated domain-containing protein n=1 Tax=Nocardioides panacisoli TaxID=627624 RepID=A0ABP7IW09_9ACTN